MKGRMHNGLNKNKKKLNVTNIDLKMCMWGVRIKKYEREQIKKKEARKDDRRISNKQKKGQMQRKTE